MLRLSALQRRLPPPPGLSQRVLLSLPRLLIFGIRPFSVTNLLRKDPLPAAAATAAEPSHFMANYLVSSCGLSKDEAARASKHLAHLKSPEKPDAVLRLLKAEGLSDAHIRRLVLSCTKLLVADVEKTLEPKIRALQEAGFSKPERAQLISANPTVLRLRDAVKKIEFWRKMFGGNAQLLKVAKSNNLLSCKIDEVGNPNLSFLRSLGVSDLDIMKIVARRPRLVSCKLSKITSMVEQVKSFGIAPASGRFVEAVSTVSNLSQTTLQAKCELVRGYGWSDDELMSAFQRFPIIFRLSEKRISRAMEFLLKEVRCRPSYVARRPVMLGYSIERRLIPRYCVLKFLTKKGLPGGDADIFGVLMLTEKRFMEKYILPIEENVRELLQTYPEVRVVMSVV